MCSPAICIHSGVEFNYSNCHFYFLTSVKKNACVFNSNIHGEFFPEYTHECERYDKISNWVLSKIHDVTSIAIEGYAYGASGRVFHISENTGLLKYKLWQQKYPLEIITPSHIKKLATGRGNADKNKMYESFVVETGIKLQDIISPNKKDIGNPVSDIIDSYYVCKSLWFNKT